MTVSDLTLIRSICARRARIIGRVDLADDFISAACYRLAKCTIPIEAEHRRFFIARATKQSILDEMRKDCPTSRRLIEKIKARGSIMPDEEHRLYRLIRVDFQDPMTANQFVADRAEHNAARDLREEIAKLGAEQPQEFFVLTMRYVYDQLAKDVAEFLGVTASAISIIETRAIERLRKRLIRPAH